MRFWPALDVIGIDAYFSLATRGTPSAATLARRWGRFTRPLGALALPPSQACRLHRAWLPELRSRRGSAMEHRRPLLGGGAAARPRWRLPGAGAAALVPGSVHLGVERGSALGRTRRHRAHAAGQAGVGRDQDVVSEARAVRAFLADVSTRGWAKLRPLRNRRFQSRLRHDRDGPCLLLSPHLDDAVIDCWSILADTGDVRVLNVFAGVPGPGAVAYYDRLAGASDSAAHVAERIADDRDALGRAGRRASNLDFLARPYRAGRPETSFAELDSELVARIPGAAMVYAPAALGRAAPGPRARARLRLGARRRRPGGAPVRGPALLRRVRLARLGDRGRSGSASGHRRLLERLGAHAQPAPRSSASTPSRERRSWRRCARTASSPCSTGVRSGS